MRPQDSFCARILYYTARMYTDKLKAGEGYDSLTRAISIVITDFKLIDNDVSHNRFRLYDKKTGAAYPESIEINTLEIPKLRKGDDSPLNRWLEFFAARTEEEFMSLAQTSPALDEAWGVIRHLSADEQTRLEAEAREKYRLDMDGMYKTGRREGRDKEREEILARMLQSNLTKAQIATFLNVSNAELEELIARSR